MDNRGRTVAAVFGNYRSVRTSALWQWDKGQILQISGLDLPQAWEAHVANGGSGTTAERYIGSGDSLAIDDKFLESGAPVVVWIYLHETEDDGETEYVVTIPVQRRKQPEDATPSESQEDAIARAIVALNAAVAATAADVQTAEQAKVDAVSAKDEAEAAKRDAVAAQGAAETAKRDAVTAKDDALQAKRDAVSAKDEAVTARGEAVAAAGTASQGSTAAIQAEAAARAAAAAAGEAQDGAELAARQAAASQTAAAGAAEAASGSAGAASGSATAAERSAQDAGRFAAAADQSAQAAEKAANRITTLDGTPLKAGSKVIEAVGIPAYVDDVAQYAAYGLTEKGWYVFARIAAPDGVTVGSATTVTGANAIVTIGAAYVDVAICFDVAAMTQTVMVNWDGTTAETFAFRASDLAVRNLDYRTTFYLYDISPFVTWEYALTSDETFVADKKYFTLVDGEYVESEVTVGASVPANTYYNHSKLHLAGMVRNVTYRLNEMVDAPIEIVLPEVPDDGYGAWFEIQMQYNGSYSVTLLPADSAVKIGTTSTQAQTAGINVIDLQYADVNGLKVWTLLNTHTNLPTA